MSDLIAFCPEELLQSSSINEDDLPEELLQIKFDQLEELLQIKFDQLEELLQIKFEDQWLHK